MKSKLYYLLFSVLLFSISQKSYSQQDIELSNRLINQLNGITNQTYRTSEPKPIAKSCITSILLQAKQNWNLLTPEAKNVFSVLTSRTSLSGTEIIGNTTHFSFHFTLSGTDAISPIDADNSGFPDYVEQMAGVFENVWTQYQNRNYTMPPLDGTAGGNFLYDVYISNLRKGLYGSVSADFSIGDNPQSPAITEINAWTSFMNMNNNYSSLGTNNTELDVIKITAAHEFFHAIQFGTAVTSTNFFMEATAAWSEDEIYPDINDNLQYLTSTFNTPDIALNLNSISDSSLPDINNQTSPYYEHWYGSWIFFRYLTDYTDSDIIRLILNGTINNYEIPVIDNVLISNYNIGFNDFFKYYLTSLDVLSSNSSYSPYTYTKAGVYINHLSKYPYDCGGVCYENTFDFRGNQLIHSSLTTISTTATFGNGTLMRLGADYFDISSNQNFKVRCLPTESGSPIQTMLLKYNLANGTVERIEGKLVNGFMEISVGDYQNYDSYTLIVYRPDYVANNMNDINSEQYVFDISTDTPLSTDNFVLSNPLVIYPNPTKSKVFFDNSISNFEKVSIANSLGQEVSKSSFSLFISNQEVDMSKLHEGVYMLKFSNQKETKTVKVIKE